MALSFVQRSDQNRRRKSIYCNMADPVLRLVSILVDLGGKNTTKPLILCLNIMNEARWEAFRTVSNYLLGQEINTFIASSLT